MPSSLILTLSEGVPLSCTLPGARTIVVNCVGCEGCDLECPWGAAIDPSIAKQISIQDLKKVLKRGGSIELVFFRCINGEPSDELAKMLSFVYSTKLWYLGMSLHVSKLTKHRNTISEANVLQIVLTPKHIELIQEVPRYTHSLKSIIELCIVIDPKSLDAIRGFFASLKRSGFTLDYPATILPTEEIEPRRYTDAVNLMRTVIPLLSDPLSPITDIASIVCPRCGGYAVLRVSGSILKLNIDEEGRCRYCGNKVVTIAAKRIHSHFIDIPIA